MRLLSLKPSHSPNKIYLKFEKDFYLPFSIDEAVGFKFHPPQEINQDTLNDLVYKSLLFLLREYALNQIALSPKIEPILRPKLKSRLYFLVKKYGLDPSLAKSTLVDQVVKYLNSKQLLNLSQFIQFYIRQHPHYSNYLLQSRFLAWGLSPADFSDCLPSVDSQADQIQKLLSKKLSRLKIVDYKTKNKIMASLVRKGFPLSLVKRTIDELLNNS